MRFFNNKIHKSIKEEIERQIAGVCASKEEIERKIADVRASIPTLTIYGDQPRFSPPLWNDLSCAIQNPSQPVKYSIEAQMANGVSAAEVLINASLLLSRPHQQTLELLGCDNIMMEAQQDSFPLPAGQNRQNYFVDMDIAYWLTGLADRITLINAADRHGVKVSRFLDFGSSSGRVLRHFPRTGVAESYGSDICLQDVEWARLHLPGVTIVQGLSTPPIPFEDNFFDLIHAGSVFTHIAEFEDSWLCELRRILKPGGLAYLTIHPERIWAEMSSPDHILTRLLLSAPHRVEPPYQTFTLDSVQGPMPSPRVVFRLMTYPVNNTNVVHSDVWIAERWGRIFELVERIPKAHGDHQDAIVLRKRG